MLAPSPTRRQPRWRSVHVSIPESIRSHALEVFGHVLLVVGDVLALIGLLLFSAPCSPAHSLRAYGRSVKRHVLERTGLQQLLQLYG